MTIIYPEELMTKRVKELEAVLRWVEQHPYGDPIVRDRKVRAVLGDKTND
jgi:hypothetical protein